MMTNDNDSLERMPMPSNRPASGVEMRVPAQALAIDEDGGNVATAEPGDAVNFRVDGKVLRVEGDAAIVAVEAINGVAPSVAEPAAPVDEFGALQRDAEMMGPMMA